MKGTEYQGHLLPGYAPCTASVRTLGRGIYTFNRGIDTPSTAACTHLQPEVVYHGTYTTPTAGRMHHPSREIFYRCPHTPHTG